MFVTEKNVDYKNEEVFYADYNKHMKLRLRKDAIVKGFVLHTIFHSVETFLAVPNRSVSTRHLF